MAFVDPMTKMLVLGAYGLIGSAIVTELTARDFDVVGMGRSAHSAQRSGLGIAWILADIGQLSVDQWRAHLTGVDVVINASGALQDGARDSLTAIHQTALENLVAAAQGTGVRLIQVSAAGVRVDATTDFMRSKALGDLALQGSDLDWTILRPTLVMGANAYGGTALLRGVAGLPGIGPDLFADRPVQTIALTELARAVASCALGGMPARQIYDLTESPSRSFAATVDQVRDWLGFAPFGVRVPVPGVALWACRRVADGLGWLGWRSPLRSAAVTSLAEGIIGDPGPWLAAGGPAFSPLEDQLAGRPATLQERWFARLFLMLPLAIATLGLFWVLSGGIGLLRFDQAVGLLTDRGLPAAIGQAIVGAGSVVDIALGLALLVRRWTRPACIGMILVSGGYMIGAAVLAPDLWLDPIGPMVKVLPSITLALITMAMLEDR